MELRAEIRRRVLTRQFSKRATCKEYEPGLTRKKILADVESPGYRREKAGQRRGLVFWDRTELHLNSAGYTNLEVYLNSLAVPEPSTMLLLAVGADTLLLLGRNHKRHNREMSRCV